MSHVVSQSVERRVVITGMGLVSPLGLTLDDLWTNLVEGRSAVVPLESFPCSGLPLTHAAEARCFTGHIDDFGTLPAECKKAIRKGLKVMCRESQMAVAAAQRALHDGGFEPGAHEPERFGCVFGSDYMLTLPEDFTASVAACRDGDGQFAFGQWAEHGLPLLNPLWLLKYLPNMPASHIAIYNDLRGPSNSITIREASGHLAIGEATMTIQRGAADIMLAGSTGTRIHPMKTVHALQNEQVATGNGSLPPTAWSRPFDKARTGMVLGEGAAVLVLEDLEHARRRGARIHGEVIGHAARAATRHDAVNARREVLAMAMRQALAGAGVVADEVGHIHAQGLSTVAGDREEAAAISDVFAVSTASIPTVAAKGHFGNLGAGSGIVECIGSLLAMQRGELFPLLNHETTDPDCPVRPACRGDAPGEVFLSSAVTPQGQAGSVVIRGWKAT
ncbi:MAG: beta-ketoacyl-[acyl-carrier-protein] synthase family protein [Planctomycetota bacterium]|jgi:3-oxoacyl-[acyl-carrier-protein] synthase II|nr:beta-ketoacyl-[acyl-carrier-protein] synthase family protein [Planctomycetota bacterium]